MIQRLLSIIVICLLLVGKTKAQCNFYYNPLPDTVRACGNSFRLSADPASSFAGKDFWVGYGHHQFWETGANNQDMVLYFSAKDTAMVTVTIDSSGDMFTPVYKQVYLVPGGTSISTSTAPSQIGSSPIIGAAPIPKQGTYDAKLYDFPLPLGTGSEMVFKKKGIHIESNTPIVAYAHIYGSASSGATVLIPSDKWGFDYLSINSTQQYANNCFSWVYVIANHDSTLVEITPSDTTRMGRPASVPFNIWLQKGHIFQFLATNNNTASGKDFTGSRVRSIANASGNIFPIAVFAGSSRTSNPASCGSGGGDNDIQQVFPNEVWGKKYLTAPMSSSSLASTFMTHKYKIVVKDTNTVITKNGVLLTGRVKNFYSYESNTADYIEADKPIMVAQFMLGGACLNGSLGDPEMIYLSPIEQSIKEARFFRNNKENISVNYVTLIVPTGGLSSLLIDGSSGFDHTYVHPNYPGKTIVIKKWTAAQASALITCDSGFTAITYGMGSVESYGYNAGGLFKGINSRYNYNWGNGQTTDEIDVTQNGIYRVTVTNADGCTSIDSAYVLFIPAPATPAITLNGVSLQSSATTGNQWYLNGVAISGATGVTYTPAQNGLYTVQTTSNGCISPVSAPFNYLITGIADISSSKDCFVGPNPFREQLYIGVRQVNASQMLQVTISDINGRVLINRKTVSNSLIETKELHPGLYIVNIKTADGKQKCITKLWKN